MPQMSHTTKSSSVYSWIVSCTFPSTILADTLSVSRNTTFHSLCQVFHDPGSTETLEFLAGVRSTHGKNLRSSSYAGFDTTRGILYHNT